MGLKIALITSWHRRCGVAKYSENLAKALAQLGVDVYVVRLPRFGVLTEGLAVNVAESVPAEADLVHVQHEYGLLRGQEAAFYRALKAHGKPIVTTMHAVGKWDTDSLVAEYSDRVIVHNRYCKRRFAHSANVVIIPHGAALPAETPPAEDCKRELGIPVEAPIVGYLGFITEYKGLELLIEAMKGVPEAALLIAGGYHVEPGTQYIVRLKQWSLQLLPGRCQWIGYVPDDRLTVVYGSFTVVVYPSRFCTESGALIMALSHGKAVIASDLPPMREKARLGALMTFKNVADLKNKIKLLLRDGEARRRLEEGAKAYAESVKWIPNIAEKHLSLYKHILNSENRNG